MSWKNLHLQQNPCLSGRSSRVHSRQPGMEKMCLWEFVFILRVNTGPDFAAPSVLKSLGVSYLFPPLQLRYNLHWVSMASICGQQFKKLGTGGRFLKRLRKLSSSDVTLVHSNIPCLSTLLCRNDPKVRLLFFKILALLSQNILLAGKPQCGITKKRNWNVLYGKKVLWK